MLPTLQPYENNSTYYQYNSPWQTYLLDQQTMTVVYPHNMIKTETTIYQQLYIFNLCSAFPIKILEALYKIYYRPVHINME